MAYLEMPIRSDVPAYFFQIALEKVFYKFDFNWNERGNYWVMSILDQLDNQIISGIKLVTGIDILEKYKINGLPLGSFFILDTTGKNTDPDKDNFGVTHFLIYRESTTVD